MVSSSSKVCTLLLPLLAATDTSAFSKVATTFQPHYSSIIVSTANYNRLAARPRWQRKSSNGEENGDDGWGDTNTSDKERELAALQLERLQRQEAAGISAGRAAASSNTNNDVGQGDGQERDLFIPIFALVSLAGLFGSYGYEMARLYSRGELYLPMPWEQ